MAGRGRVRATHQEVRRRGAWRWVAGLAILAIVSSFVFVFGGQPVEAAPGQRVDLRVLVVSDGQPMVEGIVAELDAEGVPYTKVLLSDPERPIIDAAFLSDTVASGPRAKFQSVVLPNENPFGPGSPEMAALIAFETTFDIRQVDAFVYTNPALGLEVPTYAGPLDGLIARVTASGKAGPFSYLSGSVPIDDNSATVPESYGYLARPLPSTAASSFVPLIDLPIPGSGARAPIVGVYKSGGREQLLITMANNYFQAQFQVMAHGIITWMTRGVHLGYDRNYFTVHVDDIFDTNTRWSVENHCTPTNDCPVGIDTPGIRMTAADVATLVNYQQASGIKIDMVFNGYGHEEWQLFNPSATDPLLTAFQANAGAFRWINHTYSHLFLGCVQDYTVVPWQCVTSDGQIEYLDQATVMGEITQNLSWAAANGIPVSNPHELVTGEHSGLFILPQQPLDSPNFAPALTATGITTIASDSSRDPVSRQVGTAMTVPRPPMSVFYNVATRLEEVTEYNWIYTSVANGGSGICEQHPDTVTCIAPLDPATGFTDYIVPTEATIDLRHILSNNPAPHFVHGSNFSEDRLAYPMLNEILRRYRSSYNSSAPLVQPTFTEDSAILQRQATWKSANNSVTAFTLNGVVTVSSSGGSNEVPITVPDGTHVGSSGGDVFGAGYAGERSSWSTVGGSGLSLVLP